MSKRRRPVRPYSDNTESNKLAELAASGPLSPEARKRYEELRALKLRLSIGTLHRWSWTCRNVLR